MKRTCNKGFSLVELLVSIAVLSIIMVMVVQFMGTASVTLRKTRKKIDLQSEAMEFREKFSDIMMQATYVRVQTRDKNYYELKTDLTNSGRTQRRERTLTAKGTIAGTLVSDGYPNLCKKEPRNLNIYMNDNDFTLFGRVDGSTSTTQYPSSTDSSIQSFRILTDGATSGEPYYVIPEYIYVRYQPTYNTSRYLTNENYSIFHITSDNKVYVAMGTIDNADTATNDGFSDAKDEVDALSGYDGLMVDLMNDLYLSADTANNAIFVDMQFYDSEQPKARRGTGDDPTQYATYYYDYKDSVLLRNSYALTEAPSKMFIKETVPASPEPSESEP